MKILANPVVLRAAVVFFCASFSFLLGLIFMRMLRKNISEESQVSSQASPGFEAMPMHVYNTVIQQLKQQKNELQAHSHAEQQRTRLNDAIAQTILSNLSSGVLVFGTNRLVKTSNPAAKEILGFAVTVGMSVEDIFRGSVIKDAALENPEGALPETLWVTDEIQAVLREGGTRHQAHAEYETPAGVSRDLCLTISAVSAAEGGILGVSCLIDDVSELWNLRRQTSQGQAAASAG